MYIIDKNRDFYDYLSHVYGVDKNIVFDRRGSHILSNDDIRPPHDRWSNESFLLLEVGYTQVVFIQHNFKRWTDSWAVEHIDYDMEKVREYRDYTNFFGSPISIHRVFIPHVWRQERAVFEKANTLAETGFRSNEIAKLPIFKNTLFTAHIDAMFLWMEIQNYISSQNNDQDVDIGSTDTERATNHGFDKYSFRHPVK